MNKKITAAALIAGLLTGLAGTVGVVGAAEVRSSQGAPEPVWKNADLPLDQRVSALVSAMTMKEKVSLLYFTAPGIDRVGIRKYDHGNEGLHGLMRPGKNTVFPQAMGMAATFDPALIREVASAISDEARAWWNKEGGKHIGRFSGVLTLWSPVVNMARDPRWGRTPETYGEDPFLTSRMGVSFVRGLQGDDPSHIKVIATPKHFAGNNQEFGRFSKNIVCDERYLFEYELFGFRACIMEGKAQSTMAAYTSINGTPSAANQWLLTQVLRERWGFDGYAVGDCGAAEFVSSRFKFSPSMAEGYAACLNAGLDMVGEDNGSNDYIQKAMDAGLIKPEIIDRAVSRLLRGRFLLGMFDPPERSPYSKIGAEEIGSAAHGELARKVADKSMVLLKNAPFGGTTLLPIDV
jgi:beta-glucosidase